MYLFLAPHRELGAELPVRRGLKNSTRDDLLVSLENNAFSDNVTEQTLEQFALLVCQKSVNLTRKAGLLLDISISVSTVNMDSISSHARRALATMLMNAIEYSFYERSSGMLSIHLADLPKQRLRISVSDNGWGPDVVDGTRACRLENLDTFGDLTVTPAYSDGTGMMTALTVDRKRLQEKSATTRTVTSALLSHHARAPRLWSEAVPSDTVSTIESLAVNVL